jgi:oligopeptide/dipeptide ABC transporter ATP-binding protein
VGEDVPSGALLDIRQLRVTLPTARGDIHAVRDVSFSIAEGETVAILGESGSGKTMTAMSLLGLQPESARIEGEAWLRGQPLNLAADARPLLKESGVIFQDSLSSLNPIVRIGTQLVERLTLQGWRKRAAWEEAVRTLRHVGVADAAARMKAYPHELSGGMRQRVMISMALLARPALLVADEPTTALDTTVQAQVVDLIRKVQAENRMSLILITHDLAMAAEICDRALVMYAGRIVEDVPMAQLLRGPAHPYSEALLGAMPRLDSPGDRPLTTIDGEPASASTLDDGCAFLPRCRHATEVCGTSVPPLRPQAVSHAARCFNERNRERATAS